MGLPISTAIVYSRLHHNTPHSPHLGIALPFPAQLRRTTIASEVLVMGMRKTSPEMVGLHFSPVWLDASCYKRWHGKTNQILWGHAHEIISRNRSEAPGNNWWGNGDSCVITRATFL